MASCSVLSPVSTPTARPHAPGNKIEVTKCPAAVAEDSGGGFLAGLREGVVSRAGGVVLEALLGKVLVDAGGLARQT